MLMTIETIHKDIEFTITKEREMHQNFSCEKFDKGMFSPFVSFHRILDSDTTVHYFSFTYTVYLLLSWISHYQ